MARQESSATNPTGTTTFYVQSGQQTIADYTAGANSSSPLYRYVYGSYIDEPVLRYQPTGAQSVYYHRNQQYSVTALTNASGTILERYAYTAYGTPTITNASGTVLTSSAQNNRYTYTGREWDQTISLYHYRARMYDAELGRFCGRDRIKFADTPNLYAYVNQKPTRFLDPSGLFAISGLGGGTSGGGHNEYVIGGTTYILSVKTVRCKYTKRSTCRRVKTYCHPRSGEVVCDFTCYCPGADWYAPIGFIGRNTALPCDTPPGWHCCKDGKERVLRKKAKPQPAPEPPLMGPIPFIPEIEKCISDLFSPKPTPVYPGLCPGVGPRVPGIRPVLPGIRPVVPVLLIP